jgi:hypothetical protein
VFLERAMGKSGKDVRKMHKIAAELEGSTSAERQRQI